VLLRKNGMTLMETVVVLIIIGIAAAFFFPNFTAPTEQARASNVRNNLLAIYTAQQNYNANYSGYCLSGSAPTPACAAQLPADPNCGDTLAALACNLSVNIPDDGTYLYSCGAGICTATRTAATAPYNTMVLTLTAPVVLSGSGTLNPVCNLTKTWCP